MRNYICNTTFYTYKISNPVANEEYRKTDKKNLSIKPVPFKQD